ncbi:hypothetical protein BDZ94DRAFT_1169252, partial [Collybia nuda]
GIYLISFFYCIHGLLWSNGKLKDRRKLNYPMLIAAIWLFVFSVLDLAFGFQINIAAFFGPKGDPIAYFSEASNWINVMKLVTYVAQTFMADCILLYRCWIIYSRNWKVIFVPALMWIAETVCGSIAASIETTLDHSLITSNILAPFMLSLMSLTLATNFLVTSLMVFRIRSIQTSVNQLVSSGGYTNPTLKNVILILVESGAIYTAAVLILLCTYATGNNAIYLVSDCLVQIIGIVFNLILIRVARGTAVQPMNEAIQTALQFRRHALDTEISGSGIYVTNMTSTLDGISSK